MLLLLLLLLLLLKIKIIKTKSNSQIVQSPRQSSVRLSGSFYVPTNCRVRHFSSSSLVNNPVKKTLNPLDKYSSSEPVLIKNSVKSERVNYSISGKIVLLEKASGQLSQNSLNKNLWRKTLFKRMGKALKLTCIRTLNFTKVFVQLHTRLKFPVYFKIIILSNWCSILLFLKESYPNLNDLVLTLGHNFKNDLSMYIPNNMLCLLLIGFVFFLLFLGRPCTNIIICVYKNLAAYLFSSTFSVLRKAQPSRVVWWHSLEKKVKYIGTLLKLKLGIIRVVSVKYRTNTKIITIIKQKVISYYYNLINFFQYIGLKLKTKLPKTYKIILNILYFIKILSFLLSFSFIVLTIFYLLWYVNRPERYTVFSVFFIMFLLIDYFALDLLPPVFGFQGCKAACGGELSNISPDHNSLNKADLRCSNTDNFIKDNFREGGVSTGAEFTDSFSHKIFMVMSPWEED